MRNGSARLRKTLFQIMTTLLPNIPEADPVYCFLTKQSRGNPYNIHMTTVANSQSVKSGSHSIPQPDTLKNTAPQAESSVPGTLPRP